MCIVEGGNEILNYVRDKFGGLGRKGIISDKIQYRI
jgi:hypothetical protein